jgi:hypothetical protein
MHLEVTDRACGTLLTRHGPRSWRRRRPRRRVYLWMALIDKWIASAHERHALFQSGHDPIPGQLSNRVT